MPPQPLDATPEQAARAQQMNGNDPKPLPKGVVLGKDGKPCVKDLLVPYATEN